MIDDTHKEHLRQNRAVLDRYYADLRSLLEAKLRDLDRATRVMEAEKRKLRDLLEELVATKLLLLERDE